MLLGQSTGLGLKFGSEGIVCSNTSRGKKDT